jgi:uncharacterized protein
MESGTRIALAGGVEASPQMLQVVGLGVLWVSLHCAGMCGPIVAGLAGGGGELSTGARVRRGGARVLTYQAGRAAMYALLGAVAGFVGQAAEAVVADVAKVAGLVLAVVLIAAGVVQGLGLSRRAGAPIAARVVRGVLTTIARLWPERLPGRLAAVGFAMGLLPCMLMFWVLSLAASTASATQGAVLMLTLVAMTTPVLLLAGCGPLLAAPRAQKVGRWLLPAGVVLSGVWLGLVSVAANGWIDHQWWEFAAGGRQYFVMFW